MKEMPYRRDEMREEKLSIDLTAVMCSELQKKQGCLQMNAPMNAYGTRWSSTG